jgi:hypothetical protein
MFCEEIRGRIYRCVGLWVESSCKVRTMLREIASSSESGNVGNLS